MWPSNYVLIIVGALVVLVHSSPPTTERSTFRYDPNSIVQNEKVLKLYLQLAVHTANRLTRLRDRTDKERNCDGRNDDPSLSTTEASMTQPPLRASLERPIERQEDIRSRLFLGNSEGNNPSASSNRENRVAPSPKLLHRSNHRGNIVDPNIVRELSSKVGDLIPKPLQDARNASPDVVETHGSLHSDAARGKILLDSDPASHSLDANNFGADAQNSQNSQAIDIGERFFNPTNLQKSTSNVTVVDDSSGNVNELNPESRDPQLGSTLAASQRSRDTDNLTRNIPPRLPQNARETSDKIDGVSRRFLEPAKLSGGNLLSSRVLNNLPIVSQILPNARNARGSVPRIGSLPGSQRNADNFQADNINSNVASSSLPPVANLFANRQSRPPQVTHKERAYPGAGDLQRTIGHSDVAGDVPSNRTIPQPRNIPNAPLKFTNAGEKYLDSNNNIPKSILDPRVTDDLSTRGANQFASGSHGDHNTETSADTNFRLTPELDNPVGNVDDSTLTKDERQNGNPPLPLPNDASREMSYNRARSQAIFVSRDQSRNADPRANQFAAPSYDQRRRAADVEELQEKEKSDDLPANYENFANNSENNVDREADTPEGGNRETRINSSSINANNSQLQIDNETVSTLIDQGSTVAPLFRLLLDPTGRKNNDEKVQNVSDLPLAEANASINNPSDEIPLNHRGISRRLGRTDEEMKIEKSEEMPERKTHYQDERSNPVLEASSQKSGESESGGVTEAILTASDQSKSDASALSTADYTSRSLNDARDAENINNAEESYVKEPKELGRLQVNSSIVESKPNGSPLEKDGDGTRRSTKSGNARVEDNFSELVGYSHFVDDLERDENPQKQLSEVELREISDRLINALRPMMEGEMINNGHYNPRQMTYRRNEENHSYIEDSEMHLESGYQDCSRKTEHTTPFDNRRQD